MTPFLLEKEQLLDVSSYILLVGVAANILLGGIENSARYRLVSLLRDMGGFTYTSPSLLVMANA